MQKVKTEYAFAVVNYYPIKIYSFLIDDWQTFLPKRESYFLVRRVVFQTERYYFGDFGQNVFDEDFLCLSKHDFDALCAAEDVKPIERLEILEMGPMATCK